MKIVRLIIGIASIVAFFIVFVQSCGFDPTNAHGASYGLLVGFIFIVAGIVECTMRKKKFSSLIAGILYVVAAVLGLIFMNLQPYLLGWAIASAVAGVFFIASSLLMQKDLGYGQMPKFK